MLRQTAIAAAVALGTSAVPALAADPGSTGYVHLGGAYVKQADDAALFMGGAPVVGAGFTTNGTFTGVGEVGVFLRDGFALAASAMIPTDTPNIATGVISGLGNLGDETVGFYSLTGQYHVALTDAISPYVGAGVGYMHIFDTRDGAVTDMVINSALGTVVQVGVDFTLTENIGVFADVKQYFISTTASGSIGGTPINANARVDPWVVSTGLSLKF